MSNHSLSLQTQPPSPLLNPNISIHLYGTSGGSVVKNLPPNAGDIRDARLILGLGGYPSRVREPTPVFLLGESYGQRSLAGYSP